MLVRGSMTNGSVKYMNMDDYIREQMPVLAGYFLLNKQFSGCCSLPTPFPPAGLSGTDLKVLKDQINRLLPSNPLLEVFHSYGIDIESKLGEAWYYNAMFGPVSTLEDTARALADCFINFFEYYMLSYPLGLYSEEGEEDSSAFVLDQARKIISDWRKNILDSVAQGP